MPISNVSLLIAERCSQLQIERAKHDPDKPAGEFGLISAVAAGMHEHLSTDLRAAGQWVRAALDTAKAAYQREGQTRTDEEIAGEILQKLAERRRHSHTQRK